MTARRIGRQHDQDASAAPAVKHDAALGPRNRLTAIRDAAGAFLGTILGVVPHVLHHISLLAGAAVISGVSGNALFYSIGLLLSIPMLRRLHQRFRTPWVPVIAIGVFTGLFSLSAFVIGPAISGTDDPSPTGDHTDHHTEAPR